MFLFRNKERIIKNYYFYFSFVIVNKSVENEIYFSSRVFVRIQPKRLQMSMEGELAQKAVVLTKASISPDRPLDVPKSLLRREKL